MLLQVKDLDISYGERLTVAGASLELDKGEIMSIVGESGSGKTTVIRAIMGCLPGAGRVSGGSITFDGKDVLQNTPEQWRQMYGSEMSMIFQDSGNMINPIRRIGAQFIDYIQAHQPDKSKSEAYEMACQMLTNVRLPNPENIMNSYPFELSGGMRQRVGIAMALACEPDILIADEPTTALDVTIQAQILELMQDLQKKLGMAIIMITHDLGVIAQLCDEVVVMYAGSICEQGTADEIFYNPKHEYTKGLLRSIPTDQSNGQKLVPITGTPIDLLNMPKGCPFAPRCDNAMKICLRERADRIRINEDHMATCWMNVKDASCEQTEQEEADHE